MHSTSVLVIAYPRNSSRTNSVQCSEVQTVVVRSSPQRAQCIILMRIGRAWAHRIVHFRAPRAGHVQPAVRRRRRGLVKNFAISTFTRLQAKHDNNNEIKKKNQRMYIYLTEMAAAAPPF